MTIEEMVIDLEESSNMDHLVSELQSISVHDETVHKATVSVRQTSLDERVLPELGRLPSLKKLDLSSRLGTNPLIISVSALAAFFRMATRLEYFSLQSATLTAETNNDWEALGSSLYQHDCLKEFKLIPCRLQDEWLEQSPLDPLFTALSTIPTLESVFLTSIRGHALGKIAGTALAALCRAPRLQKLTLPKFPLDRPVLSACCGAIATSTSLQDVTLGRCAMSDQLDESIAHMLRNNSTLRAISLIIANQNVPSHLPQTALALQQPSTAVESVTIWGTTTPKTQQAFLTAIQTNCTLDHVWLDENQFATEFTNYQALNALLRGLYNNKKEATKRDWVNAIATQQYRLEGIYHLLSKNPSLCQDTFSSA